MIRDPRLRWSIAAMLTLSLLTYGASEGEPGRGALIALAGLAGWTLTTARRHWGLPRWAVGVLLAGVVAWAVFQILTLGLSVSPFCGFLAAIIVVKAWERRSRRDLSQVLSICVFLNIGSMLNSNDLGVGVLLLVQAAPLLYAVMLLQLELARAAAVPQGIGDHHPPLGKLALAGALAALLVGGVVFLVLPRAQGVYTIGRFGRILGARVTGFTERVELGQAGLLSSSDEIALQVRVGGPNWPPPGRFEGEPIYLRGTVLDQYSRGTWIAGPSTEAPVIAFPIFEEDPPAFAPGTPTPVRVDVESRAYASGRLPIFTMWRPYSLRLDRPDSFVMRNTATQALHARTPGEPLRYSVLCNLDEPPTDPDWERPPHADEFENLRDIAAEVLEQAALEPDPARRAARDDFAAARVLADHIRSRCQYTTQIAAPPAGRDPIEWFLRDEHLGHCEYFASALAALCRSVGIQSRVVAGYLAGEYDTGARIYVVREANAHAWVEVRTDQDQWRTLDATPEGQLRRIGMDESIVGPWRRFVDRLESFWAVRFVNFDQHSRAAALDGLGRYLRAAWIVARERAIWLAPLAAAALALWFARARRARLGPRPPRGPERRAHDELMRALARAGEPRPLGVNSRDHVRAIARQHPELARAGHDVLDACYDVWFGGRPSDATRLRRVRQALRALPRA